MLHLVGVSKESYYYPLTIQASMILPGIEPLLRHLEGGASGRGPLTSLQYWKSLSHADPPPPPESSSKCHMDVCSKPYAVTCSI